MRRARVAGMDGLHCNSYPSVTLNCVLRLASLSASFLFVSSPPTFFKLLWVFAGYWLRGFWCCHGCMGWVAILAPPSMAAPRVTVTDVVALLFYVFRVYLMVACLNGF